MSQPRAADYVTVPARVLAGLVEIARSRAAILELERRRSVERGELCIAEALSENIRAIRSMVAQAEGNEP